MKKVFFLLLFLSQLVLGTSAVIYKSESCGHCTPYIEKLFPLLEASGFDEIQVKDFLNDQQARSEVSQIQKEFGVPLEMQGHMLTLLDGKYLFEGHVQLPVVERFLREGKQNFEKAVFTQDSMDENAPSYLFLAKDGSVKQCSVSQSLLECIESTSGTESLLKFKVDSNILVLGLLGGVFAVLVLLQLRVLK